MAHCRGMWCNFLAIGWHFGIMPNKINDINRYRKIMDSTLSRIEARIAPETKAMIQRAADIESCSLAEYLSKSAQAAA